MPLEDESPIAIGAIGGSGSRLLARIIERSGVFMGKNLNRSHDNLEFTERFKNLGILTATDEDFAARTRDFTRLMRADMAEAGASRWGWKEPNTHLVIDRLMRIFPRMRYVHLLRNGLDMAFSRNQNQLRFWGPTILRRPVEEEPSPADSLEYFCEVHRRVHAYASSPEGRERVMFVHFEDLCSQPEREVERLLTFLGLQAPDAEEMDRIVSMVSPPASIGRWKEKGLDVFRSDDVAYVKRLLTGSDNLLG